ncbi:MAG: hypothetical protein J6R77_04175 [Clostridia bacterium]|nr:hypothetical protein [Clostridia bacterium]
MNGETFRFTYTPEDVMAANRLVNSVNIWRICGAPLFASAVLLILLLWDSMSLLTWAWCGVALTSSLYCYFTMRSVKKARQKTVTNTAPREYVYTVYADYFTVTVVMAGEEHSRYTIRPRQIQKVWEDPERYIWRWDDRFFILKKGYIPPGSPLVSFLTFK